MTEVDDLAQRRKERERRRAEEGGEKRAVETEVFIFN